MPAVRVTQDLTGRSRANVLRFLLWRVLGLLALAVGFALLVWLLHGGAGRELRDGGIGGSPSATLSAAFASLTHALSSPRVPSWTASLPRLGAPLAALVAALALTRLRARRRRHYVRLRIEAYRADHAEITALTSVFSVLHKRLLRRWWRRLLNGQPSVSLETHYSGDGPQAAWMALSCPSGDERIVEAALQSAYPNCRLRALDALVGAPPAVLRLKKHATFIKRLKALEAFERRLEAPMDRVLTVMGACGEPAFVQIAITPAPALYETLAKHLYKRHEAHLSRARREHLLMRDRSMVEDAELRGGLDVQHQPLFFADIRVIAPRRATCERIASELRSEGAENRLVERGTTLRHGLLGLYTKRVQRGEGNPLPSFRRNVLAPSELAAIWQLPSLDYLTVPFARSGVPLAPASPAIMRPALGGGTLRDSFGPVSIHVQLRRQNTAVPGTVEQGKSSFLVATVKEDLRRERCAIIVLDPKGDAANAAISAVPPERTCTLLDLAQPTCGFNPLAVDAPADVIADYVVAALKSLFTDADIRASSDRYLRNAIIAVLAFDRSCTLWDAARLLSVGEEGYAYRTRVASRVRELPEFKEIAQFFTAELSAQLADARSTTTAKLDAPVNKLARLLNSPSIKRVLLNDSLRVDFDRVIADAEILVVKGALGAMGAGNTSTLMQLLVGMLDAALARQQDLIPAEERVAVALKVDEAPLVINRGFAETMALKRSAGLETVACWQTDAQWVEREVRDQLDALFAHRVYFATASARDAREATRLTMAEFSDTVRPGTERLSSLGRPDVRLHLPKHHALASWVTPEGRQPAFVAQTIRLTVDPERIALHLKRQRQRGGVHLSDLRQPHWERNGSPTIEAPARREAATAPPRQEAVTPPARPQPAPARARKAPASYRELVELDKAHSVRWASAPASPRGLRADDTDLEMLALLAAMGHLLSTQLHRHFNAGRAMTTTQRRLKRLSDAGLVERFQFHRRDGGATPMCCVIAPAGERLLEAHDLLHKPAREAATARACAGARAVGTQALGQARHDVHVAGWALALHAALPVANVLVRGSAQAALSPPRRTGHGRGASHSEGDGAGEGVLSLSDLRLPGGRTPHGFVRLDGEGHELELERFETIRPDALVAVEVPGQTPGVIDVLVELEDRMGTPAATRKLMRYDHFLAGWSTHTRRYGARLEARALVVFVCRDRARARSCALSADGVLSACRAYPGEYPLDWEYPGRRGLVFAAERDVHEGLLHSYGVPPVPPGVRIDSAHGDQRAGAASTEARELPLRGELEGPAPTSSS